ncbi:hypothetical protein ACS0TY_006024 [Phlomoides rotata]
MVVRYRTAICDSNSEFLLFYSPFSPPDITSVFYVELHNPFPGEESDRIPFAVGEVLRDFEKRLIAQRY